MEGSLLICNLRERHVALAPCFIGKGLILFRHQIIQIPNINYITAVDKIIIIIIIIIVEMYLIFYVNMLYLFLRSGRLINENRYSYFMEAVTA
jgi:hypothetical protein